MNPTITYPKSTSAKEGFERLTARLEEQREEVLSENKSITQLLERMEANGDFEFKMSGYIPDEIFRKPFEVVR